jgi:hypothetical protein
LLTNLSLNQKAKEEVLTTTVVEVTHAEVTVVETVAVKTVVVETEEDTNLFFLKL